MSVHIKKREAYKPKRSKRATSTKVGTKTFKTEEAAKKWAEAQGLKEYTLENVRLDPNAQRKKIRVVVDQ